MDKLDVAALLVEILAGEKNNSSPFVVGQKVFIRTVTHHLTGRITKVNGNFITLEEAAWIADDGRFTNCIESGTLNEVEPVTCPVIVNAASIIDMYEWRHALPRVQK